MTKERLEQIEARIKRQLASAERIMDGGENYDGADGARIVIEICDQCLELITELKEYN